MNRYFIAVPGRTVHQRCRAAKGAAGMRAFKFLAGDEEFPAGTAFRRAGSAIQGVSGTLDRPDREHAGLVLEVTLVDRVPVIPGPLDDDFQPPGRSEERRV